jgi:hypothetical protein
LRQREVAVQKAEIQRDRGYADERARLDDELFSLRKGQEKDLESKRASALTALEEELTVERVSRIANLGKEIADRLSAHEAAIQQDKDELEQKERHSLRTRRSLMNSGMNLSTRNSAFALIKTDSRKENLV